MIVYCVVKGTTTVIDGSDNHPSVMMQNAINIGFTESEVEILTPDQFDERKVSEPIIEPQPNEIENLTNYVLDVDMRLVMVELGLI